MQKALTLALVVCIALLLGCKQDEKEGNTPIEQPRMTEPAKMEDLGSVQARLNSLKEEVLSQFSSHSDLSSQLLEADEGGRLWASEEGKYPAWATNSSFPMAIANCFQDTDEVSLYHVQGSHLAHGQRKKWNGTLEVLQAIRRKEASDESTLQGVAIAQYSFIEKKGSVDSYSYQGIAIGYFSLNPFDNEVGKTTVDYLPPNTPSLIFEGYRVSSDSAMVEWTRGGLGVEEDIRNGIKITTPIL